MRQNKRKPARTKPSSRENSIASVRTVFLARARQAVKASVAEFRDDMAKARTVLEVQRDLAERLERLCGTFPALLHGYAGEISVDQCRKSELKRAKATIERELKDWLPLCCDQVELSPGWRCPAWLQGYPIGLHSPRAHMPVGKLVGRLGAEDTAKIVAKIVAKCEEQLHVAMALASNYAHSIPSSAERSARRNASEGKDKSPSLLEIPNPPHSEDYRSVWYAGAWHPLTERRAKIVEVIHSEHKRGIPEVSHEFVMRKLRTPDSRLPHSFRECDLWGRFLHPGSTRSMVKLDWPDTPRVNS